MSDQNEFMEKLKAALDSRRAWLEKTELPKLKEEFRAFHTGVSALYGLFVKKGYINEDPYKHDSKTSDIQVPEAGVLNESNLRDELGRRLSQLDNELDYLVNFYQFSTENFSQEKAKVMLGLVKYIDWGRLTPESGPVTEAVAGLINNARHASGDPVSTALLNESLAKLDRASGTIATFLKTVSDFNREQYKYDIRVYGIGDLPKEKALIPAIKKNWTTACRGEPFYPQLAEEVLKEDYSPQSESLREKTLKRIAVAGDKPKVAKAPVNNRMMLIEGLNALGSSGTTLAEIITKVNDNHELLENRKKGFWQKFVKLVSQMTNKAPDPVIYELEYTDPNKGLQIKEKLNYTNFSSEMDKKSKILAAIAPRGSGEKKLGTMEENQLAELLQKNIKDISNFHKTLTGLDEFFKDNIDRADRAKIRGIKPELSALKNASSKGSQKLYDYNAQKDAEEQFKKLGIAVE